MSRIRVILVGITCAVSAALVQTALAQTPTMKKPTAADWAALAKLPDFTGVWEAGGGGGGGARTGGAAGDGAAAAGQGRGAEGRAGRAGGAAGARAGGRGRGASGPVYTPEYAAKREALRAATGESQTTNCLPPGMPGIMGQPYPIEFLLTPGKVTIVIEAYTQVRHIYTDGRPLPADPDPTFHGTSVGRWEGDTLVVESVGFSPLTNAPHSDKMRVLERFRLSDPDTMVIETTISDAEALVSPFTTTRTLRRHRDWTIAEYVCQENNRNFVDPRGNPGVDLTLPQR